MKLVRPIDITSAVLVSSNVTQTEAAYNAGTTYAAGAIVRGSGALEGQVYASAQNSNTGHALTDAAWWTFQYANNRWAMFDQSVGSQTTHADTIAVQFDITGRVNTIGLQNVDAESVRITVTDATDGVVYDETYSMVADSGIQSWWDYFNEEIVRIADLTVTDLPSLYANPTIDIVLTDTGATVGCGECIIGLYRDIGGTKWSPSVSIQDYSTKEADAFGNLFVVERAYAKRADFQVLVASGLVDALQDLLASYRAIPILYIGDDDYAATAVYGYFRAFAIDIAYPEQSLCSLEIEGLA